MVVPLMQSISDDNDRVVYVSLHGRHAWFAMPAMFGALNPKLFVREAGPQSHLTMVIPPPAPPLRYYFLREKRNYSN